MADQVKRWARFWLLVFGVGGVMLVVLYWDDGLLRVGVVTAALFVAAAAVHGLTLWIQSRHQD